MSDSQRAQARLSNFLLFLPLLLALALTGCASSKSGSLAHDDARETIPVVIQKEETDKKTSPHNILKTAFSQVGNRYRYGGSSPETGFDCSGFVKWVYDQHDIKLPRTSGDMMALGRTVNQRELMPGDLVFFGRKKRITHVGIYTGEGKYIHSPRTGKSIEESPLVARARGEYYVGARRILPNADIKAIDDELKLAWMTSAIQDTEAAVADSAAPSTATAAAPPADMQLAALTEVGANSETVENPAPVKKTETTRNVKAEAAKKHRVVAGDTLYGLARRYEVSPEILAQANKFDKKNPVLKVGQVLTVPIPGNAAKAAQTASLEKAGEMGQTAPVLEDKPEEIKAAEVKPTEVKVAAAQPVASKPASEAERHKVVAGDTLYDLARKYKVSSEALAQANKFDKKNPVLKVGQVLTIPAPGDAAKTSQTASLKATGEATHAATALETKPMETKPAAVKAAAAQPAASKPASEAGRHKVVAGDTLYSLARKYEIGTEALAKANNFADKDKAVLKIGQVLVIPKKSGEPPQVAQSASADVSIQTDSAAAKPAPNEAIKSAKRHKVTSGDTLYDLARKYGVTTEALAQVNDLDAKKKNALKLGQVLIIPAQKKAK